MKLTHQDRILQYLKEYGSITSWEAIKEFGATRLSAVIYNLKKKNNQIIKIGMDNFGMIT